MTEEELMEKEEFIKALKDDNFEEIKKKVDNGIDIKRLNLAQYLSDKIKNNEQVIIFIVKFFLDNNIDLTRRDSENFSISLLAIRLGDIKLVQLFMEYGVDFNEKIIFKTPEEKVNLYDNKPIIESEYCISPIGVAFENYNQEIVTLLIKNNSDIYEKIYIYNNWGLSRIDKGDSLLSNLLYHNDTLNINLLLNDKNYDIKKDSNHDLIILRAIENRNLYIIKLFMENGFDIHIYEKRRNYLSDFLFRKDPIEKLFINAIIDSPYPDEDIIEFNRNKDIVKYLIDKVKDLATSNILMTICSTRADNCPSLGNSSLDLEIIQLLIDNGADVNTINKDGESLLMIIVKSNFENKYKATKLLIENGADIHFCNQNKNSILMEVFEDTKYDFPILPHEFYTVWDKLPSEDIVELLLNHGININHTNHLGMTALMKFSFENNDRLVKILLDHGADTNISTSLIAKNLTTNQEIKDMFDNITNHNPQRLVQILKNFTIDKPMKYTTHIWDFGELSKEDGYGDFDGYMDKVKKQWNNIKDELKVLSPNLYEKVNNFLWEKDINKAIGWSSISGLKKWCDDGNKPHDFEINGIKFNSIIQEFKHEIEIRSENDVLENIFIDKEEKLDEEFEDTFSFELSKLKGKKFYTDTQKFKNAIDSIFEPIKQRPSYTDIEVKAINDNDDFFEIAIIQVDSFSENSAKDILKESKKGDFLSIKENLQNLCDWSIQNIHENKPYQVNYLKSNNTKDTEEIKEKPIGFTHILRFYKS
jgi:ankyrin repeat protein